MMKFVVTAFVLVTLFLSENLAFNAENYTAYIQELSQDEKFLEEYSKRSLELFSKPDYLYGDRHTQFSCSIEKSNATPTSVHALRPSDIKCIAAIGDSLTTGVAAHAITPISLLFENRGISWSVGGDYTYKKLITLPNILRQFNPELEGFSTGISAIFSNDQNATENRLNVAKSSDHSINMLSQAEVLINRLKTQKFCDWDKDWKMITFFAGANDLCNFCNDSNDTNHTPQKYMTSIQDALDKLYNASLPRTFVNLVLSPAVRSINIPHTNGGYICRTLREKLCPCAASSTDISLYHRVLTDLINSGRYNKRDDFTVVIQPFMANMNTMDSTYFAPDCFHFSGKGHSQAAVSLWNNLLEPVNGKQSSWKIDQSLKCPTKEYPFIFTSKNSAKALEKFKLTTTTIAQTTSTPVIDDIDTTIIPSTSDIITTAHHHRKHKKSNSDSSFSKLKFLAIVVFLVIIILILTLGILRRRKTRMINSNTGHNRFDIIDTSQSVDDEVEVWSHPNNNQTTKTHGTRVSFD